MASVADTALNHHSLTDRKVPPATCYLFQWAEARPVPGESFVYQSNVYLGVEGILVFANGRAGVLVYRGLTPQQQPIGLSGVNASATARVIIL